MTLEERVAAIEARQRDHAMHDPDCPARAAQKHNARGMTYTQGDCSCWLTKPNDTPPVKTKRTPPPGNSGVSRPGHDHIEVHLHGAADLSAAQRDAATVTLRDAFNGQ